MKLPSINIILIALACAIVMGGIFFITRDTPPPTQSTQEVSPQIVLDKSIRNTAYEDTDGDGLFDWEEVLWKTNPLLKDTDDDGISDNEYVQKQMSITKSQQTATASTKAKTPTIPKELTLTDKLALETFATYVNLKQTGATMGPESAKQIAQNILGEDPLNVNLAKFTAQNLPNITADNTSDSFYIYGNEVWDIMVRNTPQNTTLENEYTTFLTAVQNQDEQKLVTLDPIITGYKNTLKDLIAMPLPQGVVKEHLELINSMNTVLALIEDMQEYFKDAARGLGVLTYYKTEVEKLFKAVRSINTLLTEKGIEYVEGESGYSLMHSI